MVDRVFALSLASTLLLPACLPLDTLDDLAEGGGGISNGPLTTPGERPTTSGDGPEETGDEPTSQVDLTTGTGDDDPATSSTSTTEATADATTDATTGDPEDPTTSGTTGDPESTGDPGACPTALDPCDHLTDDPLHALGLNCTSTGDGYVNKVNAAELTDLEFMAAPALLDYRRPWQVARSFGTHTDPATQKPFWGPREGKKLLLISTGLLPPPNNNGAVVVADSAVYNDVGDGEWDSNDLPPPMIAKNGSPNADGFTDCDLTNDCSNTLFNQWFIGGQDPEDKLWFQFKVTAPPATHGFAFDFAFFSAEFPEYVDTSYNDIFTVWQASEAYTGNITYLNGRPITSTAMWPVKHIGQCPAGNNNCVGKKPELTGTGFLSDGGASGWYRAESGVHPGETFLLSFAIFDMGDSTTDTTALLDNFRWQCDGCEPTEPGSCGVDPQ